MAEFVFNVMDIDERGKEHRLPVPTAWLAKELAGTDVSPAGDAEDGLLDVRLSRNGLEILIHGEVQARLETACSRCLEPATIDARAGLTALMTPRAAGAEADVPTDDEKERELGAEDLVRETYRGDEVVLDALVREHLLLEVPIQPLCREDCPGIAVPDAVRGTGRTEEASGGGSIDPRLAPLLKLVGKPTEE
jgi:uncharacterized protein